MNDVSAEFDTRGLRSVKTWFLEAGQLAGFVTSQANHIPVFNYTSVMWTFETSSAQTLRMDFTVTQEKSRVEHLKR